MALSPQMINAHLPKVKYALLGMAGVACLNCLSRPDYNLFLFLFLYYHLFGVLDKAPEESGYTAVERIYTIGAFGISLIIDITWLIIWNNQAGIIIIILSSIETIVKALLIGLLVAMMLANKQKQQPLVNSSQA